MGGAVARLAVSGRFAGRAVIARSRDCASANRGKQWTISWPWAWHLKWVWFVRDIAGSKIFDLSRDFFERLTSCRCDNKARFPTLAAQAIMFAVST